MEDWVGEGRGDGRSEGWEGYTWDLWKLGGPVAVGGAGKGVGRLVRA